MSVTTDTRDAVVTVINGAGLTPTLTAFAVYEIVYDLQSLAGGRLVVVPQTKSPRIITRGAQQARKVTIDVAVQYKYTTPAASEIDPYLKLAEAIEDLFLGKALSTGAVCLEASFPHGLFVQDHVDKFRVFTSVISLAFTLNN